MSRTNEDNLKALAAELLNFNKLRDEFKVHTEKDLEFDMSYFFINPTNKQVCSACAVGVAYYVINHKEPYSHYVGFTSMAEEKLTPTDIDDEEWFNWVFASDWCNVDNTPEGAAFRILYGLKHGIPEWFDSVDWGDNEEEYNDLKDGCMYTITKEFINDYESRMDRVSANPVPS